MSPIPINFDARVNWASKNNHWSNRPHCKVRVHHGPGIGGADMWGILDTGADYLTLNFQVAKELGIGLKHQQFVATASGHYVPMFYSKIEITLLGKRISVDAMFGSGPTTLIGRMTILEAIDFGIDIDGWLYRAI